MAITHGIKTNIADYDVRNVNAQVESNKQRMIDIQNKLSSIDYTLTADKWTLYTAAGDLNGYYTQDVELTAVYDPHGEIGLRPNTTLPTEEEEEAFSKVTYAVCNAATKRITFAASTKPEADFTVYIVGVSNT